MAMYQILLLLPTGLAPPFTIMDHPIVEDPQLRMVLLALIESRKETRLPRARRAIDPLILRIY